MVQCVYPSMMLSHTHRHVPNRLMGMRTRAIRLLQYGGSRCRLMSTSSRWIEIERKYSVPNHAVDKLKQHCKQLQTVQICDKYYDYRDCRLTLYNIWLRQRNGTWQCKQLHSAHSATAQHSVYNEYTDVRQIEYAIKQYVHCEPPFSGQSAQYLHWLIQHGGLKLFATLNTVRQQYMLHSNAVNGCQYDINIVLDRCDDIQHCVAEVEINLPHTATQADITAVHQCIDAAAHLLQFDSVNNAEQAVGKVERYLQLHRPQLYHLLLASNVLPKQS